MPARRCPLCNLVNPGSAVSCDCGYSFVPGVVGKRLQLPSTQTHDELSRGQKLFARYFIRIVIAIATGFVIALVNHMLFHSRR